MGLGAVQLALTGKLWGLNLVFYVLLLCRYVASIGKVTPLLYVIVDNKIKYRAKALVSHHIHWGAGKFLVS